VSPKRGDTVAPPRVDGEWDVRFASSEAIEGWQDLEAEAPENLRVAWDTMRTDPGPGPGKPTPRHSRLKGSLATGCCGGRELPQWQIEVTGGGHIWYLLDTAAHTVWVKAAGTGHPKQTDKRRG
jgi:hypothetical protein